MGNLEDNLVVVTVVEVNSFSTSAKEHLFTDIKNLVTYLLLLLR